MYVKHELILEITMQFIFFFYRGRQARNPEIDFDGNEFPFIFQLLLFIIIFYNSLMKLSLAV